MNKTDRLSGWEQNEKRDLNRNGLDDRIEPPVPDVSAGSEQLNERLHEHHATDPSLSGGDIDARWDEAESAGDETVGGSMPTPDQNVVEDIGRGMGVTYADDEELKLGDKERSRDKERWELDPASSEDYRDRAREQKK